MAVAGEEAVLFLASSGLLRSGQITLRRLVGWHDLTSPQMQRRTPDLLINCSLVDDHANYFSTN